MAEVISLACRRCDLTLADHVLADVDLEPQGFTRADFAFDAPRAWCLLGLGNPEPDLAQVP